MGELDRVLIEEFRQRLPVEALGHIPVASLKIEEGREFVDAIKQFLDLPHKSGQP